MSLQPEEIIDKMLGNDPFSQWLGIQLIKIKPGFCQLKMNVRKDMLNGFQVAHGGIAYSLADSALAFASNSHGKQALSIDTSINHFEKVVLNDQLIATATEESLKPKVGCYRVEIKKHEKVVALFRGTVYRSSKEWT
jgi:acyl-CoA thioesterase